MYVELKNGELETPLNNGKECIYSIKKNGLTKNVFLKKVITKVK